MKLRSMVWASLSSILLMAAPALAGPTDSALAPQQQAVAVSAEAPTSATVPAPTSAAATPGTATTQSPSDTDPAAAALQVPEAEPEPPPITLHVGIDLSSQRLTVKSGGNVLHSWPISSGRRGYITPNGTYQPQWRSKMWYSRQYDGSPMPHAIFFHRGYAIHGTYATGMLGRPASHGCIRLAPKHAATLYKLVDKHGMKSTQIVVHGKTNVGSPRVAGRRSQSRTREAAPRRRAPQGYANYGYYGAPWW